MDSLKERSTVFLCTEFTMTFFKDTVVLSLGNKETILFLCSLCHYCVIVMRHSHNHRRCSDRGRHEEAAIPINYYKALDIEVQTTMSIE